MADTMSELLQAPTEGYGDAIVIPAILAENFELKVGLLQLVTSSQFYGFERDDPHAHIRWGPPGFGLKKNLLVLSLHGKISFFVDYFFPPSKTTNLKNDITNFQQKFDKTFSEAWDRFKDLIRKCPHHGFLELHQIDTFYNALTQSDQDSLNAAAGGNLLNRTPRDALTIIKNKSKVRTSRNKPIVSKVSTTTSSSSPSSNVTALTEIVKELTCVTCGGPHSYYECLATDSNTFNASAATGTYNQGANPRGDVKAITTRSGVAYDGPTISPTPSPLPKEVERETEATKDKVQTTSSKSTAHVQPPVVQVPILELDIAPKPNPKPSIPYPSRLDDQKLHEKANNQIYREKLSKYNERVEELTLVTKECDETKKHYDGWRKKRLEEFIVGFNIISLKLKEVHQMITLGGDAELELVDSLDPFSEGVVFSVRPPKNSWKIFGRSILRWYDVGYGDGRMCSSIL
ncbi:reverse transcriptase domain-containing protein [Tanacetum coccineum]